MKAFVLSALLFSSFQCLAIANDSTAVAIDTTHSVKRATLLSTFVPGAGQVYNSIAMPKGRRHAYWKLPVIYAGLGTSAYFLISNQSTVLELRDEYNYRQDNLGLSPAGSEYAVYDDAGILTLHDQYATWRDLSILAFAGVYVLQIVDAAVEAHFVSFDVSEDLSLRFEPTMLNYRTAGVKLSFNFR